MWLLFVAVPGLDCWSGFVAGRYFVLALGLTADRAGRLRFFRGPQLRAGRGLALVVGGFVSWSGKLAGHPFGFLVFVV
jgi:hypothetical protein